MKRSTTHFRIHKLQIYIGTSFMIGFVLLLIRHNTNTGIIFDTLMAHSAATVFFVFPLFYFLIGAAVVEVLAKTYKLFGYENFQQRMPKISWELCVMAWPALFAFEFSMLLYVNSLNAIQACSSILRSMTLNVRDS